MSASGTLAKVLVGATALVSLAGLSVELGFYLAGLDGRTAEVLSLSYEANLPTWYASSLLLVAGLMLLAVASRVSAADGPYTRRWWLLGVIFVYMSLDEAIEIHEYLVYLVPIETGGFLYFAWVIPGALIVAALGAFYLPFVQHLPPATRRRFVLAGVLYVGGALGMELPLGWWTDGHGDDNLGYALLDWLEETLELAGATLFVWALHARLRSAPGSAP